MKWLGTRSAPPDATAPAAVCLPRDRVVNLTHLLQPDGTLTWEAPAGRRL